MKIVAFACAIALAVGCATLKAPPKASLQVDCNVPDAMVLLDDGLVGKAADFANAAKKDKSIHPGFYRVELRHPGYYSYFTEISVEEGGAATVKAELHPLLD